MESHYNLVVYVRHSGIQVSQKIKIVTKKTEILAYCQTEFLQNLVPGTFILHHSFCD